MRRHRSSPPRSSLGRALVLAIAVVAMTSACSRSWESDPIDARVVDARTGAPVADAVVLVNWQLSGAMEGYTLGQLAIFERVTDADGRFHVPAWGPKSSPKTATLDGDQPVVRVFKRGYAPLTVGNFVGAPGQDALRAERHIRPHLNGQTLRLAPFEGTLNEYSTQLNDFWRPLFIGFDGTRCDRRHAPKLFAELTRMKEEFLQAGVDSNLLLERDLCKVTTEHRDEG